MDTSYAEVGAEVVIGLNYLSDAQSVAAARKYFGKKTVIIGVAGDCCQVQIDGGHYFWPIQDMILASDIDLLQPEQKAWVR